MAKYGLIGRDIEYSFSRSFFLQKFEKEGLKDSYHNFDLESIHLLPDLIQKNPGLKGLNVTIPYKTEVIPLLDRLDKEAGEIGAVNTIKILSDRTLVGYNTDHYGFAKSLSDLLPLKEKTALILGSGGASKAVEYVLKAMDFKYAIVSRGKKEGMLKYTSLTKELVEAHCLIINCTPLGTHPKVNECPGIPYQFIKKGHVLFDLIYNPGETEFLKRGFIQGARVQNGLKMLEYQAKKSWSIWKS
jgi:shikimate dehydrogenase